MYTYVCDERKIPEACVIAAAAAGAAVRACIYTRACLHGVCVYRIRCAVGFLPVLLGRCLFMFLRALV